MSIPSITHNLPSLSEAWAELGGGAIRTNGKAREVELSPAFRLAESDEQRKQAAFFKRQFLFDLAADFNFRKWQIRDWKDCQR